MRKLSQHLVPDWGSLNPAGGKGNINRSGASVPRSGAPFHMELGRLQRASHPQAMATILLQAPSLFLAPCFHPGGPGMVGGHSLALEKPGMDPRAPL